MLSITVVKSAVNCIGDCTAHNVPRVDWARGGVAIEAKHEKVLANVEREADQRDEVWGKPHWQLANDPVAKRGLDILVVKTVTRPLVSVGAHVFFVFRLNVRPV